jgi:biopolymer transport protein ExbB
MLLLWLVSLATFLALPQSAEAWWNDEWQLRKKITIDTSATGANITDPIGTATVLVRLHVGNFRFGQAKSDGADLRFVAGDDKTPLKYHLEKYDSLLGEAFAWVQVPNLNPGQKADIWLYYGNKKAIAASDAKGTYDAATLLVYHFAERGTPPQDSSVWANGAQATGQAADGAIIGTGLRLNGQTPLALPSSPSLAFAEDGALTWSAWIKPAANATNAVLYSRHDGDKGVAIGVDNGVPYIEVASAAGVQRTPGGAPVPLNSWHHVAVTANQGAITLYVDGNSYASLSAHLPALTSPASLGGGGSPSAASVAPSVEGQSIPSDPATTNGASAPAVAAPAAPQPTQTPEGQPAPATPSTEPQASAAPPPPAVAPQPVALPASSGFAGDIDELHIAKVARPAGFIKAEAIGEGPEQAKLISFSMEEETASWLSGYFGVILRSVTIDGWVVIGALVIMAVISWFVMLSKASFLRTQSRANERFLRSYREVANNLAELDRSNIEEIDRLIGRLVQGDDKLLKHSPLYHLYHSGAAEIGHRHKKVHNGLDRVLTAPAIAAIRASLDAVMVREMQRLNRLMVVLTIAISGGPFLGLLGTVVGVMITFAAIAESGDVNVNAIAPGIAAALVATVAGLTVAIPALFGYNYLLSRIKDLTSDMQVFVDEFVTRMAELYAEQPEPQPLRLAAE